MSTRFQALVDEILLHSIEITAKDTYEMVITEIVVELTKIYPLKK